MNDQANDNTNDQSAADGARWWRAMLTRREAGARLVTLAAAALALPALGALAGCGDDEDEIVEGDALELQKSEGWNVGSEAKALAVVDRTGEDSGGTDAWKSHRTSEALLRDWTVRDSRWQPFVVPTLVQSLAQPSLASGIAPVHTASMDEAYSRGLGMREIVQKAKDPQSMVIVADLPGPESVAFAAGLADVADPVITFDNWPHPDGLVAAQQTLGAMLYYADEVSKKAAARPAGAKLPAVFILDSDRLAAPKAASTTEFDNRYVAKLPEASTLKSAGVTSVLYATPDSTRKAELDDLNEYFASYRETGVNVAMLPLSDFRPAETSATLDSARLADSVRGGNGGANGYYGARYHSPYYYGGGLAYAPLFFHTYPMFIYGGGVLPAYSRYSSVRVSRPSYVPARRATVFSSRTSGGASGVGRTKPSGFGRVSRPVSSRSGGSFGGRRSSGSYGRARGGGSM
jgi:hypothetical protein